MGYHWILYYHSCLPSLHTHLHNGICQKADGMKARNRRHVLSSWHFSLPPPQLLLEKMIGGTKFKVINKNKSEASTWPKDLACLLCLAGQMSRPKSQITSTERLIPVSTHSPHYRSSDSEEEPMTWHWLSKSSSRMMSDYVSFQEAILEFWRWCPKSRIWIERSSWIIHGASG